MIKYGANQFRFKFLSAFAKDYWQSHVDSREYPDNERATIE
jgi:hypothetical protein